MTEEAKIRVGDHEPMLLFDIEKHYYWKCNDISLEKTLNKILDELLNNEAKMAYVFGPDRPSIGQGIAQYCLYNLEQKGELLSFRPRESKVDYVP